MNEKTLKKKLDRLTVMVVIISIAILAGGSIASYFLRTMLEDALAGQMQSETEQYEININRQLDADIQTLNTLASFLSFGTMDTESFMRGLVVSREYNDFDRMGYFWKSGDGVTVTADSDIRMDVPFEVLDENVRDAVQKAWQGESAISRIYPASDGRENVFAYAVPVYAGEDVAGALVADVSTDVFAGVLEDRSVLGGQGYIHLISDTGKLLVRSEDRVVEEELDKIYDHDYISPEEQEKIQKAMKAGESCFSEFTYDNVTYQVYLDPIGVNGWYLFCVQTAQSVNGSIYRLMVNTRIITVVVLFILLIIIAYGYRMIYRSNRSLIRSAWYDPLTGAYNTARFVNEISGIVEKTREYSLAALNVRQFKFINEIFGSRQADMLLCHIKDVLDDRIRDGEYFCRSTDDMFYLFFRETDREALRKRVQDIMDEISRHAVSNNRNYQIMLYCGIVIGTDVEDVPPTVQKSMTHVRFALDTARQSMKKHIWFYDTSLHEYEKLENYVESHMHQALADREFRMFLQPKVSLETGKISGAEALVRWVPRTGQMIYPGQFIPMFENNGFCVELDLYMVEQVCARIRAWLDEGVRPVPLSVNQSKLLFYEADYIDKLKALLEEYRVPAPLITLEILEGLAMENVDALNEKIRCLREIGFRISMDDFGSGYSSLNTLANLKIDEIKFDRGFLLNLKDSAADYDRQIIIMKEIVELTKKLDISTVVEGVETAENEALIRSLGCELGQGYYYGRPVSEEEFSETYVK